jgi:hypothetical protein
MLAKLHPLDENQCKMFCLGALIIYTDKNVWISAF